MPNLPLIAGTLSYTCYPSNPQTFYNDMMALAVAVQSTTLTGVILQDATPAITDRDKVWVRTSAGSPVTPNPWVFFNGLWVAKHPIPAGSLWALPYTGSLASIDILDGGAAGVVSDNSGPFWEVVATLAARVPIGTGTLPSGLVLNPGDTGGEEKHQLALSEVPSHTHPTPRGEGFVIWDKISGGIQNWTGGGYEFDLPAGSGSQPSAAATGSTGGNGTDTDSHNTLPPYVALNFIQRTARIYCTSPMA